MLDTISVFDVDVMRGMSVTIIPVVASQPETMIEDLKAIFGSDKEGPMSGMVRFIPNQRTKSISRRLPTTDLPNPRRALDSQPRRQGARRREAALHLQRSGTAQLGSW